MDRRKGVLVLVVAVLAVLFLTTAGATALDTGDTPHTAASPAGFDTTLTDNHVGECATEPPEDFSDPEGGTSETIGWVDGYWYNEPLDIDGELENPLTDDELEELVPRTAARVEALRCLAFEEVPPTQSTTFDDRLAEFEEEFEDVDDEYRDFANAQMKAQLLVDTEEDAIDVEAEQRAGFGVAYYDIGESYMGFVVDEPGEFEINQVTLAHELLHALQDQHFDILEPFQRGTNDGFVASLAVVEGDATVLDEMYEENCMTGEWEESCLEFTPDQEDPANWGDTVNLLAAYHTPLVAQTYNEDGWEGVNDLLEAYPNSTIEAIYPEQYGEFEKQNLSVSDESTDEWERIEVEGQPYDVVGQQGLLGMLLAPTYETGGLSNVVDIDAFLQPNPGGDLQYDHPAVNGWQGDNFFAYVGDDGDRASVWKTAWANDQEAATFAASYEDLIDARGGSLAEGYGNVYTFDDADGWDMAIALEHDDERFWIVAAPTIDALTDVHDIELLDADEVTPTPDDTTPTPADDGDDTTPADDGDDTTPADDGDDTTPADADDDGAGFGVAVGALAVVLTALFVRRQSE